MLFAAGSFDGPMCPELSTAYEALRVWQEAGREKASALLQAPRPGIVADPVVPDRKRPDAFYDADWNEPERLDAWRKALRETRDLPPVLAAAIVWDAWLQIEPEQRGAWRAPLIAALLLKSRGKTKEVLLPLALGARSAGYHERKAPFKARMAGFCALVMASLERCQHELGVLQGARTRLDGLLKGKRMNSRLGALGELLLARPVVSASMAAKALKISPIGARKLIGELASLAHEISGRKRYRVWAV